MIEPDYESDEYYDEQGNRWYEPQYSPKLESDPSLEDDSEDKETIEQKIRSEIIDFDEKPPNQALHRGGYKVEDMTPTQRDPRCRSSNTELACLWPVYVGNFRCLNRHNEFDSVKEYFAARGLHVRWWFRKTDDPYYKEFQSQAGIYDMLVYFVSEEDAAFAIRYCHRTMFKGYPLNVFPGREPVYFDPSRSLQAQKMKSGRIYSELFFEKHVKFLHGVEVTCTVKFDTKSGAMEFANPQDKAKVRKCERLWKFEPVPSKLQKQRFLEQDFLTQIEALLLLNPELLRVNLQDKYTRMLLENKRPYVDPNPKAPPIPLRKGPTKRMQQTKLRRKMETDVKRITKAVAEGNTPKCYGNSVAGKRRFKKMVELAVKDHNRDLQKQK